MAQFIFTVGIAGAGKSTYRKNYPDAVWISSDNIREEVFGDVNDQTHNTEVFNLMLKRTREVLKAGQSVYYDQTGLSAKRRIGILKEIKNIHNVECICLVVATPIEQILRQNATRERNVPVSVIKNMLKKFVVPHESEGWDKIIVCNNVNNYNFLNEIVEESRFISHDNPHHRLTIGNHMIAATKYFLEKYTNGTEEFKPELKNLCHAVLFHDIGKKYCKVFMNSKKEPTEIAHYYNHENVSSYLYLSNGKGNPNLLYVANLIQYHMVFFLDEKYQSKLKQRLGEQFWRDLSIVHDCDIQGH